MEDKQIVDLYWERSESAIAETEKKYGRYCHYIAYQILENDEDAKEIVNDTYLKTWQTIPPKRPESLKPYVGMILGFFDRIIRMILHMQIYFTTPFLCNVI